MPKVCKFDSRPEGCQNISCKFRHLERSKKRKKEEYEFDKKSRRMIEYEQVILIPHHFVEKLIGYKGSRIKEVKANCTAFIKVSEPGNIVNENKREITIRGTEEDIDEAKTALFCSLLELGIEYYPLLQQSSGHDYHVDLRERLDKKLSSSDESNKTIVSHKMIGESTAMIKLTTKLNDTKNKLEKERESSIKLREEIGQKNAELTRAEEKIEDLKEQIKNVERQKHSYINEKEKYRKKLEYSKTEIEETKANYALSNVELEKAKDTIKVLLEEQENLKNKHKSEILSKDMEMMQNVKRAHDQETNTTTEINRLKHTIQEQKQSQQSKDDRIDELSKEVSELQKQHKTQMIQKEIQQTQREKLIEKLNEDTRILKLDKEKAQELLGVEIETNESLKIEFQTLQKSNNEGIEAKFKNDEKFKQLRAEMIFDQKNLQYNLEEIKLRDLTIQKLQQNLEKIKKRHNI